MLSEEQQFHKLPSRIRLIRVSQGSLSDIELRKAEQLASRASS
jgi:hypothetical protein